MMKMIKTNIDNFFVKNEKKICDYNCPRKG